MIWRTHTRYLNRQTARIVQSVMQAVRVNALRDNLDPEAEVAIWRAHNSAAGRDAIATRTDTEGTSVLARVLSAVERNGPRCGILHLAWCKRRHLQTEMNESDCSNDIHQEATKYYDASEPDCANPDAPISYIYANRPHADGSGDAPFTRAVCGDDARRLSEHEMFTHVNGSPMMKAVKQRVEKSAVKQKRKSSSTFKWKRLKRSRDSLPPKRICFRCCYCYG